MLEPHHCCINLGTDQKFELNKLKNQIFFSIIDLSKLLSQKKQLTYFIQVSLAKAKKTFSRNKTKKRCSL